MDSDREHRDNGAALGRVAPALGIITLIAIVGWAVSVIWPWIVAVLVLALIGKNILERRD